MLADSTFGKKGSAAEIQRRANPPVCSEYGVWSKKSQVGYFREVRVSTRAVHSSTFGGAACRLQRSGSRVTCKLRPGLRSRQIFRAFRLADLRKLILSVGRIAPEQHDDFDYINQMLEALAQLNYVTLGRCIYTLTLRHYDLHLA